MDAARTSGRRGADRSRPAPSRGARRRSSCWSRSHRSSSSYQKAPSGRWPAIAIAARSLPLTANTRAPGSLPPLSQSGSAVPMKLFGRAIVHRVAEAVDLLARVAVVPVVLDDPGARRVKARRQRGVAGGGDGDGMAVARVLEQHALIEQAAESSREQRVEARQVLVGKLVDRHQHQQARAVRGHRRWWRRGRLGRTGGAQHQNDEDGESMYYAHRAARRRHSNGRGSTRCQCEVP